MILAWQELAIVQWLRAVIDFPPYLLKGLGVSALPLAGMLISPQLKLRQLKAQQRRQESQHLIEP